MILLTYDVKLREKSRSCKAFSPQGFCPFVSWPSEKPINISIADGKFYTKAKNTSLYKFMRRRTIYMDDLGAPI